MRDWLDQFTKGVPIGFGGMLVFVVVLGSVIPRPPPPSAEAAPWVNPLEVEEAFSVILAKCARGKFGLPRNVFELIGETEHQLVPGRVLARAYPSFVIPMAWALAADADAPRARRHYAVILLGHLARAGLRAAREALAEIARTGDPFIEGAALDLLVDSDAEGHYRSLYLAKAVKGHVSSFRAVARMHDAASRVLLERLTLGSEGAEAQEALNRRKLIEAEDPEVLVSHVLLSRGLDRWWVRWALDVGGELYRERVLQILRTRLDRLACTREDYLPYSEDGSPEFSASEFEDVLATYWQLGGSITWLESQLLYNRGYCEDPRGRLRNILLELRVPRRRCVVSRRPPDWP